MLWPRWYVLNKKRVVMGALLTAALVSLVWSLSTLVNSFTASEKDLFAKALANTTGSSSCRYSVEVRQNGRDIITLVLGERMAPDRVHIKGALQKSQMEFTQIGDTTYMKDPWSDRWFIIKNNTLTQSELFIVEFNPFSLFNFKDVLKIKKISTEKIDGLKTVIYEIYPIIANPFLELKYSDTKFKVWIDPGEKIIRRATMLTYTANGSEGLEVDMKFWNFNEKIDISAPPENIIELK